MELFDDAGEAIALDILDPYLYEVTVGAGDVDGQRHVNNAVYVKWMDRAAYAHSSYLGYGAERYAQIGATFVVRRHEIDYLAPAFEGDEIVIATWPGRMKRVTATRYHQIIRRRDGLTLVRAHTTWIFLDAATGKPRRMPDELIADFRPREGVE